MKKTLLLSILLFASCLLNAQEAFAPSATYKFASKDGADLYLDVYNPAPGSQTVLNGKEKPTIMFVFGGGFIMGSRNNASQVKVFKTLAENGFRVIANDYRLGLKGAKNVGIGSAKLVHKAIDMAVEDLFSATAFVVENAEKLGVDPANIVVSGSSAGAITSLQAEYYICNSDPLAQLLPEGFNYAGVVSYSGAIFSNQGKIRFAKEPSPILLFHGIDDRIVNYNQIWFFNLRFAGSNIIAKSLKQEDRNYSIYRYMGYGHEVCMMYPDEIEKTINFIYTNIMGGRKLVVDATVKQSEYIHFKNLSSLSDLYDKPLPKTLDQL